MSRGTAPPAYSRIEVAGLTIGFEHAGSGPPLVLLHGGLSDHREWSPQLTSLADHFMVVAWDAPGSGRSTDPPDWYRMPDYADRLADFIEALDLRDPHVLGLLGDGSGPGVLSTTPRHPTDAGAHRGIRRMGGVAQPGDGRRASVVRPA